MQRDVSHPSAKVNPDLEPCFDDALTERDVVAGAVLDKPGVLLDRFEHLALHEHPCGACRNDLRESFAWCVIQTDGFPRGAPRVVNRAFVKRHRVVRRRSVEVQAGDDRYSMIEQPVQMKRVEDHVIVDEEHPVVLMLQHLAHDVATVGRDVDPGFDHDPGVKRLVQVGETLGER